MARAMSQRQFDPWCPLTNLISHDSQIGSVFGNHRQHGISAATFYKWRSKYGGMDASMLRRVKELEAENARLKKMYADSQLDQQILKEALSKKW